MNKQTSTTGSESLDSSPSDGELHKTPVAEEEDSPDSTPPLEEDDEEEPSYSFIQRQAVRMARYPKTHFWVAFLIAFGLSAFGMIVGEFSVSNEEGGWQARGTLIADRTTQILMVTRHREELFSGGDQWWDELINNVQPGWEDDDIRTDDDERRLEEEEEEEEEARMQAPPKGWLQPLIPSFQNEPGFDRQSLPLAHKEVALKNFLQRRLAEDKSRRLQGCGTGQLDWYTNGTMTKDTRLWPVWKTKNADATALSPSLVEELCLSEEQTQRLLEEQGLCITCEGETNMKGGSCLPPYGIVLYARLLVEDGMDMDCSSLAQAWGPFQAETETEWQACVEYIEANPTSVEEGDYQEQCPDYFHPSILDEFFDNTGNVQYTSTIFATTEDMVDAMYDLVDKFGKGGDEIEGAYDTQDDSFIQIFSDGAVGSDMLLACGSAFITTIAILIHTRSPFLTIVGVVQIILSFPLAFFAYRFLGGFEFFPFLNFIGVFVVFALGADHVFVAVDKWKNARLDSPNAPTERIAAKALPDAASAMLLTTSTTAVAFFGTAICPVAPVRLFALFCGMLIVFDYIMDVALVFPALCIYDGRRHNPNCCITCNCCMGKKEEGDESSPLEKSDQSPTKAEETQELGMTQEFGASSDGGSASDVDEGEPMRQSLIRRILLGYYSFLHKIRWPLLAACIVAFCVSAFYATKLKLPTDSDVRVLTEDVEYERAHMWRQNLLSEAISKLGGSTAAIVWGVRPADTGDHDDPASWSTLVLDESFDPSTKEAQEYLRDYCPTFFSAKDDEGDNFAGTIYDGYQCSMNKFDDWLRQESSSLAINGTASDIYRDNCNGATELPMDPESFNPCIVSWSKEVDEYDILARGGVVEVIIFSFNSRVRFDSPNDELDDEWNLLEDWMNDARRNAPAEAANAFFSSQDFWWYDTNLQMFRTAYGSAGIAIAASAVVILLSSRSLVMTLFSVLSIGYVLASVTSMMVAAGWTLGFLESICFAILIGVSVDFVIHFSHAYVAMPGAVARDVRTKHALIDMGPSILAAAFTTMAGAMVMLFCVITFFTKFAFVLFFAIVQATIGSFVFFLTLTDTIGPEKPTAMADHIVQQCTGLDPDSGDGEIPPKARNEENISIPAPQQVPSSESVQDTEEEIEV